MAGNLAAETLFVDDHIILGIPDGFDVDRFRQVFSIRRKVFKRQHTIDVEHAFQPSGPSTTITVHGMAVDFALVSATDFLVDRFQPLIAFGIVIFFCIGNDGEDVFGTEYRAHPKPSCKAEFILTTHQLFLGASDNAGIPDFVPIFTGRTDHRKMGMIFSFLRLIVVFIQPLELFGSHGSNHGVRCVVEADFRTVTPLPENEDAWTGSTSGQDQVIQPGGTVLPAETPAHRRP